jgi:ComF family protein
MRLSSPSRPRLTLPSQCAVCRQWGSSAVCADCVQRFAAPVPRCARCALQRGAPMLACGDCLREPPPYVRTVCAADYIFPWDGLISAFKFHGHVELAGALADLLTSAVRHSIARDAPLPQRVLPVPLATQRLTERGYNQAWELARRVAKNLGLPAHADVLLRHVDTAHQIELSRSERQRNLRTAFMVDPHQRALVQGQDIALVDDVMTTGATVAEATQTVLRAGAASVQVWVLARTPED